MGIILELIKKYKGSSALILLIALAAIVVTLFMYIFFNKKKIIKYIFGILGILVSLLFFILGYRLIVNPSGLKSVEIGIFAGVFGGVSIVFSLLIDTIDALFGSNKRKKAKKR